jgi:hypothetical protein
VEGEDYVNNINNTIEQYKDNPSAFIAETFESSPYAISISIKNIWLHFVTHLQGISFCHWPKPIALVLKMDSNTTAVEISLSAGILTRPFSICIVYVSASPAAQHIHQNQRCDTRIKQNIQFQQQCEPDLFFKESTSWPTS